MRLIGVINNTTPEDLKICGHYECGLLAISRLCKEIGQVLIFIQSIIWHHHMKDHVQMDHLTMFDAFMLNSTEIKLWTLRHGSKSIQMSLISWHHPPKSYKRFTVLWQLSGNNWGKNRCVCPFLWISQKL